MNERTRELLLECKKAGYEYVAIGVIDKRVPISQQIEKAGDKRYGPYGCTGAYWARLGGPPKVICAAPNRRDSGRPAIWDICEKSPLTASISYRGCGCGESHEIMSRHDLDLGCYVLAELN